MSSNFGKRFHAGRDSVPRNVENAGWAQTIESKRNRAVHLEEFTGNLSVGMSASGDAVGGAGLKGNVIAGNVVACIGGTASAQPIAKIEFVCSPG